MKRTNEREAKGEGKLTKNKEIDIVERAKSTVK